MTDHRAEIVSTGILLGLVLTVAVSRGVLGGAAGQLRSANWFAARAGLPVDDAGPDLVRRVLRRNRFVLAGAAAGVVASNAWTGVAWPVPLYAGLALGAVAARLTEPGPAPGSPRFAHTARTGVADLVPPWLVAVLSVAAAAPIALTVLVLLAPQRADALVVLGTLPTLLLILLPPAALAVSLAMAGVVVRRRRAAASEVELAVDDALRAQAVRDCLHLSAATSLAMLYLASLALTGLTADDLARRIGGWTPGVALGGLVLVALAFELTGGPLWWQRMHPQPEPAPAA